MALLEVYWGTWIWSKFTCTYYNFYYWDVYRWRQLCRWQTLSIQPIFPISYFLDTHCFGIRVITKICKEGLRTLWNNFCWICVIFLNTYKGVNFCRFGERCCSGWDMGWSIPGIQHAGQCRPRAKTDRTFGYVCVLLALSCRLVLQVQPQYSRPSKCTAAFRVQYITCFVSCLSAP